MVAVAIFKRAPDQPRIREETDSATGDFEFFPTDIRQYFPAFLIGPKYRLRGPQSLRT
jgi:hypothetical protein